jgi:hypothetical protein
MSISRAVLLAIVCLQLFCAGFCYFVVVCNPPTLRFGYHTQHNILKA